MGVVTVTWLFLNFAVCDDATRSAGSSATADICFILSRFYFFNVCFLFYKLLILKCQKFQPEALLKKTTK